MTDELNTEDETKTTTEESLKDYASRRLVELKNSEREFARNLQQAQINLERAQADVIACRGRIDEMLLIISSDKPKDDPPSAKA